MKRLGVNIDHVATLRNARGESHPDPVFASKFVNKVGADSITIHLRAVTNCDVLLNQVLIVTSLRIFKLQK